MSSFRNLLALHLASKPSGEWIIEIEGDMITIFHKDAKDIVLLHFARTHLNTVVLLMDELHATFEEKVKL